RAELDHLGTGGHHWYMPGTGEIGVAGTEHVLAVGVAQPQLAAQHDAPVRALATIVGQTAEHRRSVGVDVVLLEHDGHVVEDRMTTRQYLRLDRRGYFLLIRSWHYALLGRA